MSLRRAGWKGSMYKIIGVDGQQYGPTAAEQIRQWMAENRVNAQTLVLVEGGADWKPLGSLPEFGADLKAPPPLGQQPPPLTSLAANVWSARASHKVAAGVCGILLGPFGIHKFILGYTGPGIIMLLSTILTCGLAGVVTGTIGLIEGILYLSKSDEEFVRTYVDARKEWF